MVNAPLPDASTQLRDEVGCRYALGVRALSEGAWLLRLGNPRKGPTSAFFEWPFPESLSLQTLFSAPDLQHRSNRLLAALPNDALEFLAPKLSVSPLTKGQIVFEAGQTIEEAVFPHDCILSVVTTMKDGRSAETATTGNEGCVGFVSSLGDKRVIDRCIVQVGGTATRLPLALLDRAVERYPAVRDLQMRYIKALLAHTFRSVACTSLHTIDLRCSRWLLMAHDRVHGDTFPVKQDYLAQMLGVRRSTVGQTCAQLQDAGIIRYSRGTMTILDRRRLEDTACECYGAIRQTYERLLSKSHEVETHPPSAQSALVEPG